MRHSQPAKPLSPADESLMWSALQLQDPAQQEAYLREACGDDQQRMRHLLWYLQLQSQADSFFGRFDGDSAGNAASASVDSSEGEAQDAGFAAVGETGDSRNARNSQIGSFRLLRIVGGGGMGNVFLARDTRLERLVALKLPRLDIIANQELRRRFVHEARVAAQLEHPGLVRILEVGTAGPLYFMATQWCPFGDLGTWLTSHPGPHPPRDVAAFVAAICDALQHCHDHRVVHLDLKPSNIMLHVQATNETCAPDDVPRSDTSGVNEPAESTAPTRLAHLCPLLADFGLAQLIDVRTDTHTSLVLGTPSYMAPEQLTGRSADVGPTTDVYAVGVLLYELLAGRTPFDLDTSWDTCSAITTHEPAAIRRIVSRLPRDLETICHKCLAKTPAHRYASAQALAQDLRRFLNAEPILARPLGPVGRAVRWARRKPTSAWLVVAVCTIAALILIGASYRHKMLLARQAAQQQSDFARAQQRRNAVTRVRQQIMDHEPGWSWPALETIGHLASHATTPEEVDELRELATSCLGARDFRRTEELANGFTCTAMAFSRDGRWLAIGRNRGPIGATVYIYDREKSALPPRVVSCVAQENGIGARLKRAVAKPDGVACVAFNQDASRIAVGTRNGHVFVADITAAPSKPRQLVNHVSKELRRIDFLPDERGVIAVDLDYHMQIWEHGSSEPRGNPHAVLDFGVDPRGRGIAMIVDFDHTLRGRVCIVPPERMRQDDWTPYLIPGDLVANRLRYSGDGRWLAAVPHEGAHVVLVNVAERHFRKKIVTVDKSGAGVLDHYAVNHNATLMLCTDFDDRVTMWDLIEQAPVGTVAQPLRNNPVCLFSPDGDGFAMAAAECVEWYELRGDSIRDVSPPLESVVHDFQFAPAGSGVSMFSSGYQNSPAFQGDGGNWAILAEWTPASDMFITTRCLSYVGISQLRHFSGQFMTYQPGLTPRVVATADFPGAVVYGAARPPEWFLPRDGVKYLQQDAFALPGTPTVADAGCSDGVALELSPGTTLQLDKARFHQEGNMDWHVYGAVRVPVESTTCVVKDHGGHILQGEAIRGGRYHWFYLGPTHHSPTLTVEGSADSRVLVDALVMTPFPVFDEDGTPQLVTGPLHGPLKFSATGDRAWVVVDETELQRVDGSTGRVLNRWSFESPGAFRQLYALDVGRRWSVVGTRSGHVVVFDEASMEEVARWKAYDAPVADICLLENVGQVVVGAKNGQVDVFQLADGHRQQTLPEHRFGVVSLSRDQHGRRVLTAGSEQVILWQHDRGKLTMEMTLDAFPGRIDLARLSPDGQRLGVHLEQEDAVRLWNLAALWEAHGALKLARP